TPILPSGTARGEHRRADSALRSTAGRRVAGRPGRAAVVRAGLAVLALERLVGHGHAGRGRPRDARPDLRRLVRPDLHELPVDDAPLLRVEAQHGHLRGALERADAQLVLHGAGRAAADVPHAAAEPDRTGAGVHVARDLVRHARRVERLVAHARGVDEQEVDAVAVLLRRARDLREPGRVLLGRLLAR